ncbi:DUF2513 domain-containing protein [Yersinia pseudotuberculosis]|uniref:DUF2513 domain-containing protein n=1 Tax=Yersinia pseudotuberculosis TaxID=633 RepID=UPI0003D5E638|nr:DUF2513 domain-containing protein [Yersinia pseudotuberculosis]AJJ69435.1 hypothetical protein BZ23_1405 [Yersinia pseudotuberculosis]PSH13089.1 hypothetical protein B7R75_15240 [Yersinia pseudotuberculosis]PSH33725.1 hypothetical protein BLA47_16595 [Yersinia pseudotuberculosis]VEG87739.1 Uncharacterised protein [Yersinia pseudotuberculosis]GAE12352.1 hypothetical protein YP1_065_00180 [Yersinia pseudotuberculosis NBRC 105692]
MYQKNPELMRDILVKVTQLGVHDSGISPYQFSPHEPEYVGYQMMCMDDMGLVDAKKSNADDSEIKFDYIIVGLTPAGYEYLANH